MLQKGPLHWELSHDLKKGLAVYYLSTGSSERRQNSKGQKENKRQEVAAEEAETPQTYLDEGESCIEVEQSWLTKNHSSSCDNLGLTGNMFDRHLQEVSCLAPSKRLLQ